MLLLMIHFTYTYRAGLVQRRTGSNRIKRAISTKRPRIYQVRRVRAIQWERMSMGPGWSKADPMGLSVRAFQCNPSILMNQLSQQCLHTLVSLSQLAFPNQHNDQVIHNPHPASLRLNQGKSRRYPLVGPDSWLFPQFLLIYNRCPLSF